MKQRYAYRLTEKGWELLAAEAVMTSLERYAARQRGALSLVDNSSFSQLMMSTEDRWAHEDDYEEFVERNWHRASKHY